MKLIYSATSKAVQDGVVPLVYPDRPTTMDTVPTARKPHPPTFHHRLKLILLQRLCWRFDVWRRKEKQPHRRQSPRIQRVSTTILYQILNPVLTDYATQRVGPISGMYVPFSVRFLELS
jgi:hypothetical protein